MKFVFVIVLVVNLATGCRETNAAKQQGSFPFTGISHFLAGHANINITLKHERINGKINDGPIQVDQAHWTWPFWDLKNETDFNGSWHLDMAFFNEDTKYGRLVTTNPLADLKSRRVLQEAAIYISLYTRAKNTPGSCKVGVKELCGLSFTAAPTDLEKLINSMATEGEITFTDLGTEKIGQRIRGTYWGTDKKHFTVKGEFDLQVVKVEKR